MRSDDNLPPGCTGADIDRHMGPDAEYKECPECGGDGNVMDDGAPDAKPITCPKCGGEGEIEKSYEEIAEEAQDRQAERADRLRDDEIDRQMGL